MARWTGEWLPGTGDGAETDISGTPRWRGERLGLPENGPGSAASGGARVLAFMVDLVLAGLVTSFFLKPDLQNTSAMQSFNLWSGVAWAVITVIPAALFGFTPGMAALGIRVARIDGVAMVGVWRAVVRGVLSFVIIPAAVRNIDGRSWADRATTTVVLRMR